jgi:peptidoglycan/xylan/chitin deacetylase (PgdA/CDA1 family)
MWLLVAGIAALLLSHTAPFPFLLEYVGPDRSLWKGPHAATPTVYLTYDDGPNPDATPALLDVLRREGATATFFIIPEHLTADTAPIVRRTMDEGHVVALHSRSRSLMLLNPAELAMWLDRQAGEIERLTGTRPPCRLFRPHAGWRGGQMYEGLNQADYTLAGWSLFMWDFNWWRPVRAGRQASRLAARASDRSIIVMHDGHHRNPRADRRHTVAATAELIPRLRARGLTFGTLCPVSRGDA